MKLYYLTNISDPILKTDKKHRKYIRSLLVSEINSSAFINGGNKSADFDYLLSDNGNFTRLSKIAKKYSLNAKELDEELDQLEKDKKSLPVSLIKRRIELNAAIIIDCKEAAKDDFTKITAKQLSISPHGIIGGEDTTIPVLQIAGAFDFRLKNIFPGLAPFQNRTLSLYSKQYSGGFGGQENLKKVNKYLVVHAINYNTLARALKKIGKTKYDAIALSLGGPLESKRFIKELIIGNKKIDYQTNSHPEKYLLSVALLLALRKNINKNIPIHILGLGSPILILLAGYLFKDFKFVTIDSTATYQDVDAGDIYGNKQGLIKMDLYRLAATCIVNKSPFHGISPYFKTFEKKYKPDWNKLYSLFNSTTKSKNLNNEEKIKFIQLELKKNADLLKKYIPFFTPMKIAAKNISTELRIARSFENYWVNNSICTKLSSFSSGKELSKYVLEEVKKYEALNINAKNYVDAVYECVSLINKY